MCLKVVLAHRRNFVLTVDKGISYNKCLCPEKFTSQPANSNTGSSSSTSDSTSKSGNFNATTTQSLLASCEKVVLQTATVSLQTFDGNSTMKARVDSASQRTFMTNQLAQKLNLSLENKEILSVSTFGVQKATDIHTYVVF